MSAFNDFTWRVARKQHQCVWCFEFILVGESHAHYVGTWEGEFQNWRMHEECHEDYDINLDPEEGFMPGDYPRPKKNASA